MKTFTLILGDINFNLDGDTEWAIINKKDRILHFEDYETAESEGERLISDGSHLSYIIPEVYKGTITDQAAESYLNRCRTSYTSRYIGKLMR